MSNYVDLIPVKAVTPTVQAQSDIVVYVPKASKTAHGIVKLGNNIIFDKDGAIIFDESVVNKAIDDLKTMLSDDIAEVSEDLLNYMRRDDNPHNVTKDQIGLSNVDNTSDINKPISDKTQKALDRLSTTLSENITSVDNKTTEHIKDQNNPHKVTKDQVGLANVDNTSDADKPVSKATKVELDKINSTLRGINKSVAYLNYSEMVSALNNATKNDFFIGQSIYINAQNIPDLWVYGVDDSYQTYNYTNNDAIINTIESNGFVKIGYYKISALETQKTVVGNYVTLDTVQNITGTKVFTEQIGILNGSEGEINYIKHINNNFLISSSDGENIINIDEQLKTFNFYNKPLALEAYVKDNYISYTTQQTLTEEQKQIARNNIGAGTGGGGSADLSNYVTLDTEQTIVAEKTINAPLEVNSTSADHTKTSHLTINPNSIQLMNQDTSGKGGSLVITPSAGVQVSTSGTSKFTHNGKEVLVGGELVDKVTQIKNTSGTMYSALDISIIDGVSLECHKGKGSNSYMQMDLGYIFMGANEGLDYNSSSKSYTLADGKTKRDMPIQCIFGAEKSPKFIFRTRDYDIYENYTEFQISPTGVMYNGKEVATKDDIQSAITTTLNTAV